jgi:hypothetical protein
MIEKSSFPSPPPTKKIKLKFWERRNFLLLEIGECQGRQDQSEEEEEGKTLIHHLKQERG